MYFNSWLFIKRNSQTHTLFIERAPDTFTLQPFFTTQEQQSEAFAEDTAMALFMIPTLSVLEKAF